MSILTAVLFTFLIGDSLTLSPFGFTFHYKDDYKGYSEFKFHRNAIDKNQQWTIHPELNLIYKSKYMQYNLFWMRDSYDKHAFGGTLGPKIDIFEHFSLGIIGGAYAKQHPGSACHANLCLSPGPAQIPSIMTEDFQIIPLAALTASVKVPVSKKYSIEVNTAAAPILIHTVIGLRFDF